MAARMAWCQRSGALDTSTNLLNDPDFANAMNDLGGNSFEAFLAQMIMIISQQAAADGKINPAYYQAGSATRGRASHQHGRRSAELVRHACRGLNAGRQDRVGGPREGHRGAHVRRHGAAGPGQPGPARRGGTGGQAVRPDDPGRAPARAHGPAGPAAGRRGIAVTVLRGGLTMPGPDALALEHELTADLEVIAERDPSVITPAEWQRAIDAHTRLVALGLAGRRGWLR
jgi:hypothetical protein